MYYHVSAKAHIYSLITVIKMATNTHEDDNLVLLPDDTERYEDYGYKDYGYEDYGCEDHENYGDVDVDWGR